ncbi:MAG: hypothetical protein ABSG42_09325, partial [Nitrospirota bacterium]
MSKLKSALIVSILAAISLSFFNMPASAAEKRSPSREELKRIQEELKGVKKKEKETAKKERSVLSQIENMDQSLALKRAEVRRLEAGLAEVTRGMNTTQAEMEDYRAKAKNKESDLAQRLRAMYITDRAGGPWVVLASGDYDAMLKRYKYLSAISRRDKSLMDGYQVDITDLSHYSEKLKEQHDRWSGIRTARDAEAAKVQAEEARKKTLLASIREQKGAYEAMAGELEDSSRKMQEMIKKFEEEAKSRQRPSLPLSVPGLSEGLD